MTSTPCTNAQSYFSSSTFFQSFLGSKGEKCSPNTYQNLKVLRPYIILRFSSETFRHYKRLMKQKTTIYLQEILSTYSISNITHYTSQEQKHTLGNLFKEHAGNSFMTVQRSPTDFKYFGLSMFRYF